METRPQSAPASRMSHAFTLIEMLVSIAVLTLMILLVTQLVNSATNVTISANKHMDADSQARMVFDRLADDLAAMPKRSDVDFFFSKVDGGGQHGNNDQLYFYSGVPGLFTAATSST